MKLENGLTKEWIITNGIGGYAGSTACGANTRKYHGLLVAPLNPPLNRCLILSKLDESIEIAGEGHALYTNMCKNYISEGYKYLDSFTKEYIPTFNYSVKKVKIEKQICMEYGKNTVYVLYTIKNDEKESVKLTLAPIINYRNFHHLTKTVPNITGSIFMNTSEGEYIEHKDDVFYNMYYIEEEKRGFEAEENLLIPGRYEIDIPAGEEKEISFVCSLDKLPKKIDAKKIINTEIERLNKLINFEELKPLIIAADNFVIKKGKLHSIIAGYPWFADWARDAFISFEGLLLVTERYDIAKDVLKMFIKDIKCGLVPNGYDEMTGKPLYNSADASLLLFEAVQRYVDYSGDYEFIGEIKDKLAHIIESYKSGITLDDNNIYLDTDYLLVSGTEHTQNTWMDAKAGGNPVTPRNGKAVEINAMWYNALIIMGEIAEGEYHELAEKTKKAFMKKFYNKDKKCLYDVIGDDKIRPNQIFALSLTNPIIEPNTKIAKEILATVTDKLVTKYGLKTLAKGEENYKDKYEGDEYMRDASYHQGIIWPWLLGPYGDSLRRVGKVSEYKEFVESVKKVFGSEYMISELYDTKPKGTMTQAWSVAEVLRILVGEICE